MNQDLGLKILGQIMAWTDEERGTSSGGSG